MRTNKANSIFARQVIGIVLMAAGWGWIGGNFVPDNQVYFYNALAHFVPILLLMALSLRFFAEAGLGDTASSRTEWGSIGLSVFAAGSLLSTIILIFLGASNSNPDAIGVKTLPDWFSTIILDLGTIIWMTTLIPSAHVDTGSTAASHE